MMGLSDVRSSVGEDYHREASPELAGEIDRLNKEWREKRDSFRASKAPPGGSVVTAMSAAPSPQQISAATPAVGSGGYGGGSRPSSRAGPLEVTAADGGLCAAAASGSVQECRRVLERGLTGPNTHGLDGTTPLCAAALWGHADVVRMLLDAGADVGLANRNSTRPTALHMAALQEHGKICMMLLSANADANVLDGNGVSPKDFASCSEAVWPLFAAAGCTRSSKEELLSRGVIRKASSSLENDLLHEADDSGAGLNASVGVGTARGLLPEFSRPGSAYVVTAHHPPRPGSALPTSLSARSLASSRPLSRAASRPIDILEEGESGGFSGGGYGGVGEASGKPPTGKVFRGEL